MDSAEVKIEELRKKSTEEVADYFVKESAAIDTIEKYWYQYYILANVSLRGKLGAGKAEGWKYEPTKAQTEASFNEYLDDKAKKNYGDLLKNDSTLSQSVEKCKKETLGELLLKKDEKSIKFKEWLGPSERNHIELRDFDHNLHFMEALRKTKFYKRISTELPKGVIHHFHWSAGLTSRSIVNAVRTYVRKDLTNSRVLVRYDINKKDRSVTKKRIPGNTKPLYLNISAPKFFIIDDYRKAAENYKDDSEAVKYFKTNFVEVGENKCLAYEEPNEKNLKFESKDDLHYAYLRNCLSSNIYTDNDSKDILIAEKDATVNSLMQEKQLDIGYDFRNFLNSESNILKSNLDLMHSYLPNSY